MARYRDAVRWIALNEETAVTLVETMEHDVCVVLVADVWGKAPREVAEDVIRERLREEKS